MLFDIQELSWHCQEGDSLQQAGPVTQCTVSWVMVQKASPVTQYTIRKATVYNRLVQSHSALSAGPWCGKHGPIHSYTCHRSPFGIQ